MGPWTEDEINRLRELVKVKTLPHIATDLGRDAQQVRYQIRKLGLSTKVPWERPITEVRKIKKFSDTHGVRAAAEKFKLTVDVVKNIRRRHVREMDTIVDELNPEALMKLRKRAAWHATAKGRPEHGEDFGSMAVIRRMTHETFNLDYLWIEYLRETFGNTKTDKGLAEVMARARTVEVNEDPDFESESPGIQVAGVDGREVIGTPSFEALAVRYKFKDDNRTIFFLHFQWGMSQDEIATILDVTPSRISQKITNIMLKVKSTPVSD